MCLGLNFSTLYICTSSRALKLNKKRNKWEPFAQWKSENKFREWQSNKRPAQMKHVLSPRQRFHQEICSTRCSPSPYIRRIYLPSPNNQLWRERNNNHYYVRWAPTSRNSKHMSIQLVISSKQLHSLRVQTEKRNNQRCFKPLMLTSTGSPNGTTDKRMFTGIRVNKAHSAIIHRITRSKHECLHLKPNYLKTDGWTEGRRQYMGYKKYLKKQSPVGWFRRYSTHLPY